MPLPPLTVTVTGSAWAVVILGEPGATVTVGVINARVVTVTVFEPVAVV